MHTSDNEDKGKTPTPWVSFCMSTYKRPVLLRKQLQCIARQTFSDFEVIISDNDVDASARTVVAELNDPRFCYFNNGSNLGMVKSFNKSLERATATYITMITDDDPVQPDMLEVFFRVVNAYPGYSAYCGCVRIGKEKDAVEAYSREDFPFQLLHPGLTSRFLWSSCILKREAAIKFGFPDYGSPHLADHAMLALCGAERGGVFINNMYSYIVSHDANFSKSNFRLYYTGCKGFYELMSASLDEKMIRKGKQDVLKLHLYYWFFTNAFTLLNYFTYRQRNREARQEIIAYSRQIIDLPFMRDARVKYYLKRAFFYVKYPVKKLYFALFR